jgi:hypothetical protein
MIRRLLPTSAAVVLVAVLAGCSGSGEAAEEPVSEVGTSVAEAIETLPAGTPAEGGAPWPAPTDAIAAIQAAGLEPLRREFLAHHVHSHLDVFVNGELVPVPAFLGINIADPGLQAGEACADPCIAPLHTHDDTGVVHIESAETRSFTLGQLFAEWGVALDDSCVGGYCEPDTSIAVYVDGQPYDASPAGIPLLDRQEIAIVIGTPPPAIPASYDWSAYG